MTKAGFEAADQLWLVPVLRRVESIQVGEFGYVDFQRITLKPFFGQQINAAFAREKLQTLASMDQLEIVPVDGGIGGVRLNNRGRKTLREHSSLEFAEPDRSA